MIILSICAKLAMMMCMIIAVSKKISRGANLINGAIQFRGGGSPPPNTLAQ
jgi:hypothetical protein